ncbi:hypothetical protein UFOVP1296_17 [uncultured Caudovirales phage]|uniref:Uncharacterized protein n=1 Tax=uncultured Caudovirales phage TaxID=2100421 RepID=A0A6J5PD17_9CAUD|nr:hypothetical protein UFOVP471_77 [uncultured Caudovirales phage]CAB4169353.1 hypothetical protein UFOVP890_17 [uncultured Caudovirales phage]CAB4195507.1 hypothetical protein UFOVP1296_17 [uncultured Caudovirales phage]
MNPADEIVLKALEPFMTDDAYAYVVEKTIEAGGVRELTDPTARMQLELAKRAFGGDRSAAASYAANARWKGKKEEFLTADNQGVKQRSAKMGGVNTQFDVKPIKITDIKTGDIVSLASTKTPQKVTAIAIKDGKAAIATQDLSSNNRYNSIAPSGGEGRLWTPISQEEVAKRAFGGDRSAAAAYAANARWRGASIGSKGEAIGVTVNGSHTPVNFSVTETAAADVKFGDTILNAHGQPAWVTGSTIKPSPAGYDHIISSTPVAYTTGRSGQLQHSLPPNFHASSNPSDNLVVPAGTLGPKVKVLSAVGLGKANGSTSGRIDASRKIDPSKITAADTAFINGGANGPERVRRRTQVIDTYASQGKDVSIPSSSGPKGGAQWLGTSGQ